MTRQVQSRSKATSKAPQSTVNPQQFEWPSIYRMWNSTKQGLGFKLSPFFQTEVVNTKAMPGYASSDCVDWWRKSELQFNQDVLNDKTSYLMPPGPHAGILHTASLMANWAESEEQRVATYILASLLHTGNHAPSSSGWGLVFHELTMAVERAVWDAFPDIWRWHHRVRNTLPLSFAEIFEHRPLEFKIDLSNILKLMIFEAAAVQNEWVVVKYDLVR